MRHRPYYYIMRSFLLSLLIACTLATPVTAAAQNDVDPRVRAVACHALGTFGNSSVLPVLLTLSQSDADAFVRDQATIAMLRL